MRSIPPLCQTLVVDPTQGRALSLLCVLPYTFREIYTDLVFHKIGLVVLIAITATTIHKHGGVHEWDLTLPEVHQAIYVSNTSLMV